MENPEKEETLRVTADAKELPSNASASSNNNSIGELDEPVPHLHAKTFLTVFAVCLVYFAQLINVVGAGAVCKAWIRFFSSCKRLTSHDCSMRAISPPSLAAPLTRFGCLQPSLS